MTIATSPSRSIPSRIRRPLAVGLPAVLALGLAGAAPAQEILTLYASADAGTRLGSAVGAGGDINADGRQDWVIGAQSYFASRGLVDACILEEELWSLVGAAPGDRLGASVAICGDVNGDGRDDVIAGAPGADGFGAEAGAAFIYSGLTGALLMTLTNGTAGSAFGTSVDGGPDVNGDGKPDLLVGAPFVDIFGNNDVGGVYVMSGATGTILGVRFGTMPGAQLGTCVRWAGDVNHDGVPDYMAGAPGWDSPASNCGRVEVYSGADNQILFSRNGTQAGELLGFSVDGAGDFDKDGFDDVIVGGYGYNGNRGSARILRGPAGTLGVSWLGNLPDDRLGYAVAGVGDVDKDGWDDVMYGVPQWTAGYGYADVRSGRTWLQMWKQIDGTIAFNPAQAIGDHFGAALGGIGDGDGDGWLDVIVAAPDFDNGAVVNGGRVYVDRMIHSQQQLYGYQGAGSLVTYMEMYGSKLYTQGQADLKILDATPDRPVYLIASVVQFDAPFKGGILAPDPGFGQIIPLNSGPTGDIVFQGVAGGGGPLTVYLQAIVNDPIKPTGWTLTNPIVAEFLP